MSDQTIVQVEVGPFRLTREVRDDGTWALIKVIRPDWWSSENVNGMSGWTGTCEELARALALIDGRFEVRRHRTGMP